MSLSKCYRNFVLYTFRTSSIVSSRLSNWYPENWPNRDTTADGRTTKTHGNSGVRFLRFESIVNYSPSRNFLAGGNRITAANVALDAVKKCYYFNRNGHGFRCRKYSLKGMQKWRKKRLDRNCCLNTRLNDFSFWPCVLMPILMTYNRAMTTL